MHSRSQKLTKYSVLFYAHQNSPEHRVVPLLGFFFAFLSAFFFLLAAVSSFFFETSFDSTFSSFSDTVTGLFFLWAANSHEESQNSFVKHLAWRFAHRFVGFERLQWSQPSILLSENMNLNDEIKNFRRGQELNFQSNLSLLVN